MKLCVAIDRCKRCMKGEPEVVIVNVKNYGFSTVLKILCRKCYDIQKEEGTLYG